MVFESAGLSVWSGERHAETELRISLGGALGNMGLSYSGMELLPELLRNGRWLRLWREARALVASRRMRWRGVLVNTFGPWCPSTLWVWLHKIANGYALEVHDYTAIHPCRLAELDLFARASALKFDLFYRPWKDGFAMRMWGLHSRTRAIPARQAWAVGKLTIA